MSYTFESLNSLANDTNLLKIVEGSNNLELLDRFNRELNSDIKRRLDAGEFKEQVIPHLGELLETIGLDKDMPDEGMYIENLPNLNASLLFLIFGAAHTEVPPIDTKYVEVVKKLFKITDIDKFYELYIRVMPLCLFGMIKSVSELSDALFNFGEKLEHIIETIS